MTEIGYLLPPGGDLSVWVIVLTVVAIGINNFIKSRKEKAEYKRLGITPIKW